MSKVSFKLSVNALVTTAIAAIGMLVPYAAQAKPAKAGAIPRNKSLLRVPYAVLPNYQLPFLKQIQPLAPHYYF